jgi:hypothetical protein
MSRSPPLRAVVAAVLLLAALAGVAVGARWILADRYPLRGGEWWRPAESAPFIDPATLARAEQQRKALDRELAERRERVRPVPEALKPGEAVLQAGPAGSISALGWFGPDLLSAGLDGTLRVWRPASGRLLLLLSMPLPAGNIPAAVVGVAKNRRVWVALEPDLLVQRWGDKLELESRRFLPDVARVLDLAVGDDGARTVLLVEPAGRSPGTPPLELRHHLAANDLPLKSVPLQPSAPILASALAPDGLRVALLLDTAPVPTLELRRADEGTVLSSSPLLVSWWPADGSLRPADSSLALGTDFVLVADRAGIAVADVAPDGTPSPFVAWPTAASDGTPVVAREACAAAVVLAGPGSWSLVRRNGSSWERAEGGTGAPSVVACADSSRLAWSSGGDVEVRAPDGSGRVGPWPILDAVGIDESAARLLLLAGPSAGSATAEVVSVDLRDFRVARRPLSGAVRAFDVLGGVPVVERDGALWREPEGGSAAVPGTTAGDDCAAVRGDALALLRDGAVELVSSAGARLGRWSRPAWLGGAPRVSLARDGRTVVLTGEGGFVAFRVGEPAAILDFPGEGYADAPADLLPGGARVAIGRNDGTLELWSIESGEADRSVLALGPLGGAPTALWAADDGETIYAGGARGAVGAWRVRTGSERWAVVAFDGPVTTVVPFPRAGFVLASDRRKVALLSVRTGDVLVTFALDGAGDWVAATPDGYHVASRPAAAALLGLRLAAGSPAPTDRLPFRLVTAGDPDFGTLGGALDALRVTLLGAAEPASGEP